MDRADFFPLLYGLLQARVPEFRVLLVCWLELQHSPRDGDVDDVFSPRLGEHQRGAGRQVNETQPTTRVGIFVEIG